MTKCGDAELVFLKGIEVLPQDESEKAISASEEAYAATNTLLQQARTFLLQKLQEVKRYSKETVKSATDELTEHQKRVDAVAKKLNQFKSDTQERKVNALMAEAIDPVTTCEAKGAALTEAAKIFSGDLETASVEALKEAGEKTAAAEKECSAAIATARKVIADKQKVAKDRDLVQGLSKLTNRINAVHAVVTKAKKDAAAGTQLVKGKEVSVEAEAKISEAEAQVEKLVKLSKPEEEGLGVEKIADETILQIEEMGIAASKTMRAMVAQMQPLLAAGVPALKSTMTKLVERTKKAQAKIDEAKAGTKQQREKVLSESYVKEATAKTVEMEGTLDAIAAAELPYLKGIEVLPVEESKKAMSDADEASKAVQAAISATRTLVASKNIEMKKFEAASAKASIEEFVKLSERVNSVVQKLNTFKKDTESRKKKASLQEAGVKVTEVQAEVEKVNEAMKPIMEKDADTLSPEEASSMVKALEELEKSAQAKVQECRNFLAQRSRDAQGDADNTKTVSELQAKLATAQADLAKAKKLSSNHNQKLMAKALIQEAGDEVKKMEEEFAKATAACSPLVEEKCQRFLAKFNISTMCAVLRSHMEESKLSEEDMHKKLGGSKLNQDAFVAFLGQMPEQFKKEECSWPEEKRIAMFKCADADADGIVNLDEFKAMFVTRHACVHGISVTDVFDIGSSKTICKLEVGAIVEGYGNVKPAEDGVPRLQCKVVSSGQEGWVTTQGNGGTKYLDTVSPIKVFGKELQVTLTASSSSLSKVTQFFATKTKDLAIIAKDSPLVPAKEEVAKLRLKVNEINQGFGTLKQKVEAAKSSYPALELKEKNAHIEAKERKEADVILAPAQPLVEAVDAELKKLEEAAKPLTERQGTDILLAFETPISLQDSVKAIEVTLKSAAEAAKKVVKEQQALELVAKSVKGPMLEAKKDLSKLMQQVSQALVSGIKVVTAVKTCCITIGKAKLQLAATTIRAELLSQGVSLDDFFARLAPDGERIPEKAFVKYVKGLKDLGLSAEHAKLLIRQIEEGGVSRRSFNKFLQKFLKVVKEIAITPVFDIVDSKEKPVRKAEMEEIMEVIEGPKVDEKSGLERVRVKALKDGAEGWVSVKGNQGKVFLSDTEKPFYACMKDVVLEKDFKTNSQNSVRTLKADEVVELIEGPCQETLGSSMRLKGKATLDGKIGWFTMKDQNGTEFVEKSGKVYTCTATVAITDAFEINSCKVLKKLTVNEVFTISEGPVDDPSGVQRVKGKTAKDDVEGWITIKGNAGTTYAKANEKLYTVKTEVPMQQRMQSDSPAMRNLAADEAIEVLEGPKEEKFSPVSRVKVRAASDRAIGWVTMKTESLRSWKPLYKFVKAAPLYTAKGMKESIVREVVAGDILEMLSCPVEDDGVMWVKVQAKKDSAVGWAPMKDEKGARLVMQVA
jgi:hypothetical protein